MLLYRGTDTKLMDHINKRKKQKFCKAKHRCFFFFFLQFSVVYCNDEADGDGTACGWCDFCLLIFQSPRCGPLLITCVLTDRVSPLRFCVLEKWLTNLHNYCPLASNWKGWTLSSLIMAGYLFVSTHWLYCTRLKLQIGISEQLLVMLTK